MRIHRWFRTSALTVAIWLVAVSLWAQTWIGKAAGVKQISTITVADTWAAADTGTVTINGKAMVVTAGSDGTTTANIAIGIRDAINANSRLDGTGTTAATSNFGGQEFGEFAEFQATIYTATPSVVHLIGTKDGRPFTFSVAETTAGSGTLTAATPTAATGPNFWNNTANWDTGVVPANDGTTTFRDSDVSCLYGLPNGSLKVTLQVWQSFTGSIGLPLINRESSKPYYEYRQRYLRLDDAGTGTNIGHRFGLGTYGSGSPLINLKHSTVKCSPIVYNTGQPATGVAGQKALNICCTNTTSTLNILNGSVDFSSQDGSTSSFVSFAQTGGDSIGINGLISSTLATVSGGTSTIGGSVAISQIIARGGRLRLENQTGTISTLQIHDTAIVEYPSTGTINTLSMLGGTFDCRGDAGTFQITNSDLYNPGCKFIDPYRRLLIGTDFIIMFDPSPNLQFGTAITNPLLLDNSP